MRRWPIVLAAAVALAAATVAIASPPSGPVSYQSESNARHVGLRPTGVGLPQIGFQGSVGAADFSGKLRFYHDSGDYQRDFAKVTSSALAYLGKRLDQNRARSKRVRRCKTTYKRKRLKARRYRKLRLYKRVRKCRRKRVTPPRLKGKPAMVLDIDETSLSNYRGMAAANFTTAGTVPDAVGGTGTALGSTLSLYRWARDHGVAVFFVTGRPSAIGSITERNLRSAGYTKGWQGLSFKPSGTTTVGYKAGRRAQIERAGYDIVVNLGDQESDLDGGHADQSYKLPNPFYFIGDG